MTRSDNGLAAMAQKVAAVNARPDFSFDQFLGVFKDLDRNGVCALFNEILTRIQETTNDPNPPFGDQLHLLSDKDFNLTLKTVGVRSEQREQITASEFDMLVYNITPTPIAIPVYRMAIDLEQPHLRPPALREPETVVIPPYEAKTFQAYKDTTDLGGADHELPVFVVHSLSRGSTTWVFDRETGEPLGLTDNHLQTSRVRMAMLILRGVGYASNVDSLEKLAVSDYLHAVRWSAAETIYGIDPQAGARVVERLAEDTHPSIREAAQATLANMRANAAETVT